MSPVAPGQLSKIILAAKCRAQSDWWDLQLIKCGSVKEVARVSSLDPWEGSNVLHEMRVGTGRRRWDDGFYFRRAEFKLSAEYLGLEFLIEGRMQIFEENIDWKEWGANTYFPEPSDLLQYMGSWKSLQRKTPKPNLRSLKDCYDLLKIYATPGKETRPSKSISNTGFVNESNKLLSPQMSLQCVFFLSTVMCPLNNQEL